MATKPAKKKGSGKKAAPAKKKGAAKKKSTKTKESPERATFREQLESSARYHLEKWNQKMGMTLKKVKQAEDSELIDELLTKFDEGEIALNDLAPKKSGGKKSTAKKNKATDPEDDDIDELLDDELTGDDEGEDDGDGDGEDDDEGGEDDDDIDALLDDELGDGDDEGDGEEESEEEPEDDEGEYEDDDDAGKSALEDKLDQIINQNTKIANKLDKTAEFLSTALDVLVSIDSKVKESYAFLRVYTKAALKINKVKEGVFDKIYKKAKAIAKKDDKEDE